MLNAIGMRGRIMTLLAVVSTLLAALTAALSSWVELVFGVSPDAGSGALEVGLVAGLLGAAVAFGMSARKEAKMRMATQV